MQKIRSMLPAGPACLLVLTVILAFASVPAPSVAKDRIKSCIRTLAAIGRVVMQDLTLAPFESRNFTRIGEYLIGMGVSQIRLLSNNPKKASDIAAAGVNVQTLPLKIDDANEHVRKLYMTKAAKFGHSL